MDRTTAALPPRQRQELMDLARREGVSFGELVRRTLEREIKHPIGGAQAFSPPRRVSEPKREQRLIPPPLIFQTAQTSATQEYLEVADIYDIFI